MVRRLFILHLFLLSVQMVAFPASGAAAVSTVDCHCFRDRAFSAENPSAFDPYLLATVQNRLLAHAFSLPRKEIVSAKMSGARGEALWVAHWIAKATGRQVVEIQALYEKARSWESVVKQLSADPERLGGKFWAALPDNNETLLAWAVVSEVSKAFLEKSEADYAGLEKNGATLKEAILACVLAKIQKRPAAEVLTLAQQRGDWGSLLVSSGLSIESIEGFLSNSFSSQ